VTSRGASQTSTATGNLASHLEGAASDQTQRHHSFAVPAVFLIDRTGMVRWQHVDQDYKTRPTPAQMLDIAARALAK
jgi:hypothetical protein